MGGNRRLSGSLSISYNPLVPGECQVRTQSTLTLITFLCAVCALAQTAPLTQSNPNGQPLGPERYSPSSSLSPSPEPEDGRVASSAYSNPYFAFNFPLLPGWQEDLKGPIPSALGDYILVALRTNGELKGAVSIEAQDMFFAPYPVSNAMEYAKRREHQAAFFFQDVIDRAPQSIKIAGHPFVRLDYTGAAIHHAAFSTVVRCHVITVEVFSRFPDVFDRIAESVNHLSLLNGGDPANGEGWFPVCVKDYATDATILHRVEPEMVGPRFTKVPARFVIDSDGKVKHIHVINALPVQGKSVEDALAQWTFKPYMQNGKPVEVETGIVFEFPPRKSPVVVSTN
jgi:hypothetical protein